MVERRTSSANYGEVDRPSGANSGAPGELLPPRELQDWVGLGGPSVFKATGEEFVGYLVDLCGLRPGDAVLDVACGSGRMALPLTGYLSSEGRYAGFDVAQEAIAWCAHNISASHPNFDFRVVDVHSKRYNPAGKCKSSGFHFPYDDESFDVVLLASVFTHMLPAGVKHYMSEISRVLKPGGRSLITFFLLNEMSSALSKAGMGHLQFEYEMDGARTANVDNPEAAIAYPEAVVRKMYKECGLELREPVHYGNWCGRPNGMSGQDVVIAIKPASRNPLDTGVGATAHPGAMGTITATTPTSGASTSMSRMSRAAAEDYIGSLYATILKRDPTPEELAHWVNAATALLPEQVYFAFVNSKEYKLRQEKSVATMFSPGHYYSPIVDPSTISEYIDKQYSQEPDDISAIHFDEGAMVRFWKENADLIKNTSFSQHDDGKSRYYYDNGLYPYADALVLRAMIAKFKPKNVIEIGSGFSTACMLDAADHFGLDDLALTCIEPNAERLRGRLREEDRARVDIIEGLVQDVPVSTFAKLKKNDILFIDSSHVLKTASDVHYELFSILPSLSTGVLIHVHDIGYPFEYARRPLLELNPSWNEIYALRAFLMYNSAFEVVFWNGLFAQRQRDLVLETNPRFLWGTSSIYLRVVKTPLEWEDLARRLSEEQSELGCGQEIIASPTKPGGDVAEETIRQLFSELLARSPEEQELKAWVGAAQGMSVVDIVKMFIKSDEFRRRLKDEIDESHIEEIVVRPSMDSILDLWPRGRIQLRDWPPSGGTLKVIEAPKVEQLSPPEFVCNLSGKEIPDWIITHAQVHGSYLVSRSDVLLFGPNFLVSQAGLWACETRAFKQQYMEHVARGGFPLRHHGTRPGIEFEGDQITLDCSALSQNDVELITDPVFLATPLEPDNWGRWLATTLPKCAQFKEFGNGRKFLCRNAHPWQRGLLRLLGIEEAQLLEHDPGKTYFCRDVQTVEYSSAELSVSEAEKQIYADLADACRRDTADTFGERIFVSRLSVSAKHPGYRVLQNERDLIAALEKLGFTTVQPERLPLKEQIGMFARAKCVVALGGAALFGLRFCSPGTTVVDIESSDHFIRIHSMMLSSMRHRFGVIFGQQDSSDPTPVHKRWTVDVENACAAIQKLL